MNQLFMTLFISQGKAKLLWTDRKFSLAQRQSKQTVNQYILIQAAEQANNRACVHYMQITNKEGFKENNSGTKKNPKLMQICKSTQLKNNQNTVFILLRV